MAVHQPEGVVKVVPEEVGAEAQPQPSGWLREEEALVMVAREEGPEELHQAAQATTGTQREDDDTWLDLCTRGRCGPAHRNCSSSQKEPPEDETTAEGEGWAAHHGPSRGRKMRLAALGSS